MIETKVIVTQLNISILREDLPLEGGYGTKERSGYLNPRPSKIYEARFDWAPGLRSEDFRFLRGHGATEEEAVAVLHQEKERMQS